MAVVVGGTGGRRRGGLRPSYDRASTTRWWRRIGGTDVRSWSATTRQRWRRWRWWRVWRWRWQRWLGSGGRGDGGGRAAQDKVSWLFSLFFGWCLLFVGGQLQPFSAAKLAAGFQGCKKYVGTSTVPDQFCSSFFISVPSCVRIASPGDCFCASLPAPSQIFEVA